MSPHNVLVLTGKELRDSWRNRWFLAFAATFTVLALAMSWMSVAGAAGTGFASLGRTAASLVSLVVLIVPLTGLVLGAGAIAGERERGSLLYLLAQPVSAADVVVAKFLGAAGALVAAVLVGFGLAALVIGGQVGTAAVGAFLGNLALAALVACASVSLGLLLSAASARSSLASGAALMTWLVLVLLGDLGLMGTSLVLRLDGRQLLTLALVNPLEEFKIAALALLRGGLDVLGPGGLFAQRALGPWLVPILAVLLVSWSVVPLLVAVGIVHRRGAL